MTDKLAAFKFHISLAVRVSDLNYGNHVGNQNFLSYFQEARVAYLNQFGYSEMDMGGCGMILAEAGCKYKRALFLNDHVHVACAVVELKSKRFTMAYLIERDHTVCAEGFTINLAFDYQSNKVVRLPEEFIRQITEFENL
jgi:acyl-CoA thioester hydrolase